MSRAFPVGLLFALALGGCRQREAPVVRVLSSAATTAMLATPVAPLPTVATAAVAPVAPLELTVPCEATAALNVIGDGGLQGAGRIRCNAPDGGAVYSVALPSGREARRALAAASIVRGHIDTASPRERAAEIEATLYSSSPPRGVPFGLFLRDPDRHALAMGLVEGAVTGARDVNGLSELEVTTALGAVVVTVPGRAPDDVYAGQRVQAYGLWYRLEDGAPRLAAIIARNPQSSAQRPARRIMRTDEETGEYE